MTGEGSEDEPWIVTFTTALIADLVVTEEQVLKQAALAPHYQLEVFREGSLDALKVNVELAPDAAVDACESVTRDLTEAIKSYVGVSAQVEVQMPGGVPRSEGKAVRVIDNRPK